MKGGEMKFGKGSSEHHGAERKDKMAMDVEPKEPVDFGKQNKTAFKVFVSVHKKIVEPKAWESE
eukprot:CAMPEP_0185846044 /NCGR_PEP_ID=MMETSP1354-20130828/1825_1 /TAXON_ID=708628 /ORGANISM="Erythrolobus madagascarensis, Strain CCMP3276" /LENGTH=63 /DNA_ID=CAMNT_0028546127 /DNA_START=35 /DNA_END=226 /DNA_ORIENTATION=-